MEEKKQNRRVFLGRLAVGTGAFLTRGLVRGKSNMAGESKLLQRCVYTAKQGEGPFRPTPEQRSWRDHQDNNLTQIEGRKERALGALLLLSGTVQDRKCKLLRNYTVEIWQANHFGRYNHPGDQSDRPLDPNFQGFGKAVTNGHGQYQFLTILPGEYGTGAVSIGDIRPRHIHFKVFNPNGREVLTSQMYFQKNHPLTRNDRSRERVPSTLRRKLEGSGAGNEILKVDFPLVVRK